MRKIIEWILWNGEKLGSRILSKIFWPPCSASAIILDGDKILAVRNGDYLMLPGGLLESGESFEDAVEREVKEETGLEVEVLKEIGEDVKKFSGVEKIFTVTIKGGELESSWEGNPEYLDKDEAVESNWRWGRDIEPLIRKAQL